MCWLWLVEVGDGKITAGLGEGFVSRQQKTS